MSCTLVPDPPRRTRKGEDTLVMLTMLYHSLMVSNWLPIAVQGTCHP